jgi:hypothetical protein
VKRREESWRRGDTVGCIPQQRPRARERGRQQAVEVGRGEGRRGGGGILDECGTGGAAYSGLAAPSELMWGVATLASHGVGWGGGEGGVRDATV